MIDHLEEFAKKGWTLVPGVYDSATCEKVKEEFYKVEPEFIEIQRKKGLEKQTENATHHTLLLCRSMLEMLEKNPVHEILEVLFGGKFILSTMGLSRIVPNSAVYTQNIHRDVRSFTGENNLWINTLIMLDDSTLENGATHMLEGSHLQPDKPEKGRFFEDAVRAVGKKGDVLIFNGNIWHCAGKNITDEARHIITPIYCKPFIKQQLDYPRAFGIDYRLKISCHLAQILGYNALTPSSLDEFYQKDEDRFYKSDQG